MTAKKATQLRLAKPQVAVGTNKDLREERRYITSQVGYGLRSLFGAIAAFITLRFSTSSKATSASSRE
jgi:hypothetical protein